MEQMTATLQVTSERILNSAFSCYNRLKHRLECVRFDVARQARDKCHKRRLSDSSMASTSSRGSEESNRSSNRSSPTSFHRPPSLKREARAAGAPDWSALPVPQLQVRTAQTVLFLIAVSCFAHSFNGAFVFDDAEALLNNKDVTGERPLREIFRNDFWGSSMLSNTSHKSYRPLTIASFRLNNAIFGMNAHWFHLLNILLHGVVTVLVFQTFSTICSALFPKPEPEHAGDVTPKDPSDSRTKGIAKLAFLAAVLFAVHPIHAEPVANIVGRAELLSALFFLICFLRYAKNIRGHDCDSENDIDSIFCHNHPMALIDNLRIFLETSALAFCGVLCKEQGITVLPVCAAFDIVAHLRSFRAAAKNYRKALADARNNNLTFAKHRFQLSGPAAQCLIRVATLCLSSGGLLLFRFYVMGFSAPVFAPVDNPAAFHPSFIVRTLNYNYIFALNLWLLLAPAWLCFDWSMGCVPLIESVSDQRLLVVFAFWYAGVWLVCQLIRHHSGDLKRIVLVSSAILLIPFLPASNLFFSVGFVVADRVLYLPSIGFCLLAAVAIAQTLSILKRRICKKFLKFCLYVMILFFASKSVQRTTEWKTEETLFLTGAQICPLNAKVHYNIGKIYSDSGRQNLAEEQYRLAIRLNPGYDQAMNNLANLLKDKSEFSQAESLLLQAVRLRPNFAAAWMNLGIVQASQRKFDDAERSYNTALLCRRNYADCYFNLGNLHVDQRRFDEAVACWQIATQLKPTHAKAWTNLVILADNNEQFADDALKFVGNEPNLHFAIANAYGKASQFARAEKHYRLAISLEPQNANFNANLGVLYHRWGKLDQAKEYYIKALTQSPQLSQLQENLELLRKDSNNY